MTRQLYNLFNLTIVDDDDDDAAAIEIKSVKSHQKWMAMKRKFSCNENAFIHKITCWGNSYKEILMKGARLNLKIVKN